MNRRALILAGIVATALTLAGCETRGECEARGGKWVTDTRAETVTVNGKVTTRTKTTHDCVAAKKGE